MANFRAYQSICQSFAIPSLNGIFASYAPLLLQVEGGFTKNPADNGNWTGGRVGVGQLVGTNFGISAPLYAEYIKRTPTESDMRAITKTLALKIYEELFWRGMNAHLINSQSVANILVDHAINAGKGRAGRMMQEVLNARFGKKLKVDGVIGPVSVQAINSVNSNSLHDHYKKAREDYYKSLVTQGYGSEFINGWLNRVQKFVYEKKKSLAS